MHSNAITSLIVINQRVFSILDNFEITQIRINYRDSVQLNMLLGGQTYYDESHALIYNCGSLLLIHKKLFLYTQLNRLTINCKVILIPRVSMSRLKEKLNKNIIIYISL